MQEEVEQRTLTLVINGTKFSGRVLKSAVSKFVAFYRNQKAKKINVHPKGFLFGHPLNTPVIVFIQHTTEATGIPPSEELFYAF